MADVVASLDNAFIRVPSKKFFRKWKPARLSLTSRGILQVKPVDSLGESTIILDTSMRLSDIFQQSGGPLSDAKPSVFFCRLVREVVGAIGETNVRKSVIGPASFLDDNDTEPVLKFGCTSLHDLKSFVKVLNAYLTTSPLWEFAGRHRGGSKTEGEEVTPVRNANSDIVLPNQSEALSRPMAIKSTEWDRFEATDPYDLL